MRRSRDGHPHPPPSLPPPDDLEQGCVWKKKIPGSAHLPGHRQRHSSIEEGGEGEGSLRHGFLPGGGLREEIFNCWLLGREVVRFKIHIEFQVRREKEIHPKKIYRPLPCWPKLTLVKLKHLRNRSSRSSSGNP